MKNICCILLIIQFRNSLAGNGILLLTKFEIFFIMVENKNRWLKLRTLVWENMFENKVTFYFKAFEIF